MNRSQGPLYPSVTLLRGNGRREGGEGGHGGLGMCVWAGGVMEGEMDKDLGPGLRR